MVFVRRLEKHETVLGIFRTERPRRASSPASVAVDVATAFAVGGPVAVETNTTISVEVSEQWGRWAGLFAWAPAIEFTLGE